MSQLEIDALIDFAMICTVIMNYIAEVDVEVSADVEDAVIDSC